MMACIQKVNSSTGNALLPQRLFLVFLFLFAIMIMYCLSLTLDWQMAGDTSPIHYTAWRILQGDRLYEDVFDVSWPGSPLIHMLAIAVFGKTDFGFRMFDLLWICLLCASLFVFFQKPRWRGATAASLCFIACYLAAGELDMQEREIQMLPFLILALHFIGLSVERKRSVFAFVAGFLLGFVVYIKPFPAVLLAMLLVFLLITVPRNGDARATLAVVSSLCGGFLVPSALIHLWLWRMNAVQSFWQLVLFIHYRLYRGLNNTAAADVVSRFVVWTIPTWPVLVSMVRVRRIDPRMQLALIGLAYGLFHYFYQSKGWSQHVYIAAAFFLVTGFYSIDLVVRGTSTRWRYASVAFTAITLLLLSPLYLIRLERLKKVDLVYVQSAMSDLLPLVKTANEVQPIENMAGLINALYRLNLTIPARYLHSYPFYHSTGDEQADAYFQAMKADFIARLSEERVRIIIVDHDDVPRIQREYPALAELLEHECYLHTSNEFYSIFVKREKVRG
ncbi:MAG: hypothetical protein A2177_14345 [Spirochaetes bacterium RBG_13_68_11]|nr:MAG: hypothetical protein A2177_14345 [Spirochaetes bacterium RBG_13_68_11]